MKINWAIAATKRKDRRTDRPRLPGDTKFPLGVAKNIIMQAMQSCIRIPIVEQFSLIRKLNKVYANIGMLLSL